jgi:paraquat-inducible protein B
LIFKQSVRGLSIGAPVEIGGIKIGEVTSIEAKLDAKTAEFSVPVAINIDPMRYGVKFLNFPKSEDMEASHKRVMDILVSRGLRAELKTGNLISGSLFVAVNFFPDEPPATLDWLKNPVEFPTVSSKVEAIEDSVASLLKNLDKTVVDTRGTLTNANGLIQNLDKTLATTRGTLTNADVLLNNAGSLVAPDSTFNAELINLLQQGGDAAQALRVLADYLERHPEALIRGKTGEAKP